MNFFTTEIAVGSSSHIVYMCLSVTSSYRFSVAVVVIVVVVVVVNSLLLFASVLALPLALMIHLQSRLLLPFQGESVLLLRL